MARARTADSWLLCTRAIHVKKDGPCPSFLVLRSLGICELIRKRIWIRSRRSCVTAEVVSGSSARV